MKIDVWMPESVGFLEVRDGQGFHNPIGTCFYVHSGGSKQRAFIVTCLHVVEQSIGAGVDLYLRMNKIDGTGVTHVKLEGTWLFHETHQSSDRVDVAVLEMAELNPSEEAKFNPRPLRDLLDNAEAVAENKGGISIGDDVMFLGLFEFFPGHTNNSPLFRFGKVAMLANERITGVSPEMGSDHYYLIECQVYPKMSGSPAYVEAVIDGKPRRIFAGMMAGYYYSDAKTVGEKFTHYGISLMVPAYRIADLFIMLEANERVVKG